MVSDLQLGDRPVYETARAPLPLGQTARELLPEVDKYVNLQKPYSGATLLKSDLFSGREEKFVYAGTSLFDVFDLELTAGNRSEALNRPFSLVLTESAARRYFGSKEPVGEPIVVFDTLNFTVTAVIRDIPESSHFDAEFFASMPSLEATGYNMNNWTGTNTYSYLLLNSKRSKTGFEERLNWVIDDYLPTDIPRIYTYRVQNLTDIHLHSHRNSEWKANANYANLMIMLGIAIVVLLLGAINYTNLSTALAAKRYKEIGVRKYLGAGRSQLIRLFVGESVAICLLSSLVAIAIVGIGWTQLAGVLEISIPVTISKPVFWAIAIALGIFTGLIAGIYPAVVLSGKNIMGPYKGDASDRSKQTFRKMSTAIQFAVTSVLVICTVVMLAQFNYINSKEAGFEKEGKVAVPMFGDEKILERYETLKQELGRLPSVVSVTASSGTPGRDLRTNPVQVDEIIDESDPWHDIRSLAADEDFVETYEVSLISGRNFIPEQDRNSNVYLVNRAFTTYFGWIDPEEVLNKEVNWRGFLKGPIVGVVENFHYLGFQSSIEPTVIAYHPGWFDYITVSLAKGADPSESLAQLQAVWGRVTDGRPFDYYFVENDYLLQYQSFKTTSNLAASFSLLAIAMAGFGIFTLLLFHANRRMKEIAVRKVLGANISNIGVLLSRELLNMLLVSVFITVPVAYLIATCWLQGFVYHIQLNGLIFAATLLGLAIIVLAVVAIQSYRSYSINPTLILKSQ